MWFCPVGHERDWRVLMRYAEREDFTKADCIVNKGDLGDSVYILLHGEVEVVVKRPVLGEKLLAIIPEGSVFGEMAFFEQKPRTATVRARTACRTLKLTREAFERMTSDEPSLAQRLLFDFGKVLSMRNRNMSGLVLR